MTHGQRGQRGTRWGVAIPQARSLTDCGGTQEGRGNARHMFRMHAQRRQHGGRECDTGGSSTATLGALWNGRTAWREPRLRAASSVCRLAWSWCRYSRGFSRLCSRKRLCADCLAGPRTKSFGEPVAATGGGEEAAVGSTALARSHAAAVMRTMRAASSSSLSRARVGPDHCSPPAPIAPLAPRP